MARSKRFRLRYSLGTLFVFVTLTAWVTWQCVLARKRENVSRRLSEMGLYVFYLDTYSQGSKKSVDRDSPG